MKILSLCSSFAERRGCEMKSSEVVLATFTGTGNTLLMARALAAELVSGGKSVSIASMEHPGTFALPEGAALGLAVPIACFSTYPTAWRFIDSLPPGEGREAFLLATMGGVGAGMDGPIRKVLLQKGYKPIGSRFVVMPSNYANKEIPAAQNEKKIAVAGRGVKQFANALLTDSADWGSGKPVISSFFAWMAHGRKPWKGFYRMFPLRVFPETCVGCGVCRDLCPEDNISMAGEKAVIGDRCQSCQRCVGFCPVQAIAVPGKPAQRYRSVALDEIVGLIKKP